MLIIQNIMPIKESGASCQKRVDKNFNSMYYSFCVLKKLANWRDPHS